MTLMKPMTLIILLLPALLLSGCGKMMANLDDGIKLGGKILPLNGLVSSNTNFVSHAYASICTDDVYARLHKINEEGKLGDLIQSVRVQSDASYEFKGIEIELSQTVSYQVVVDGCDMVLSRPVTDINLGQDVTYLSTVVGESVKAEGLGKVINQVERKDIESLLKDTVATNMDDAFQKLASVPELKNKFVNVFNSQPDVLLQTHPSMTLVQIPAMLNEGMTNQLKLGAYHWSTSYEFAYEWYVDGVLKYVGNPWNYSPTGNEQGSYSIRYIVGQKDASGAVDKTKPYVDGVLPVVVMNTIPAVAPDIAIAGNLTISNSRNLSLDMITGSGKVFCESFSDLALTEEVSSVPTNMNWFNLQCDTAFVQTINYALVSPGDGVKTLRLWAKDSSGNISALPKTVSIQLDTTPPGLAFVSLPAMFKGGAQSLVNFSVTDSSPVTNTLYYAQDGLSFSSLASGVLSPYSWTLPTVNTASSALKIISTDSAGNTSQLVSNPFAIDSIAPANPVLTLTSSNPTNSTAVSLSLGTCNDVAGVSISEGNTPLVWNSCALALNYVLSDTTQGTKTIKVWAKDAAGNISGSSSVSLIYDSLPPAAPTVSYSGANPTSSSSLSFSVSDCTDRAKVLVNSGATPLSGDAGWITCSTTAGALSKTFNTLNTNEAFHFWSKDIAGNISSSSNSLSVRHDNLAPDLLEFILSPKTDDPSVGYDFVGTSFTNVSVKVSDPFTGTKIRLKLADAVTGDCSLTAAEKVDGNWKDYVSGQSPAREYFNFNLSPGDGTKKVCLWAKDTAGNISPDGGPQFVAWDDVEFRVGNIPQVTAFTVKNAHVGSPRFGTTSFTVGETVSVSWTVEDQEGLDVNPITLDYVTTSGTTNLLTNFGSLSGNEKTYTYTHTFPAPTASYFRLRIRAKDSASNSSVAVMSDSCNTGNWSVYAGTTDRGVGGGAKAALFQGYSNGGFGRFAVNPRNNDIWVIDLNRGVLKLDAVSGIVSKIINHGTTNFGTSGTVTSSTVVNTSDVLNFVFGSDGMLYFVHGTGSVSLLSKIYKLDPQTMQYELYAGGGNQATSSDPFALATIAGPIAIDEDLSIYTQVHCFPGTTISSTAPQLLKLYKFTQNPTTKKADTAIHIAGDCSSETVTTGGDARLTKFSKPYYPPHGTISVWDHGDKIIYGFNGSPINKIIGGKMYSSNLNHQHGLAYNRFDGKVYSAISGLQKIDVNVSGNNGDVSNTVVPGVQTLNCTDDDILASNACASVGDKPYISETGTVFFMDGATMNNSRASRIRYIGDDSKVRTALGSQPNNGDGLHKSLVRAPIGGIYYKKATEGGTDKFPEGLYFVDSEGITFNYINPVSGMVTRLLGNQSNIPAGVFSTVTPPTMTKGVGLGAAYGAGASGKALMFDENGFPMMINDTRLFKIDADFKLTTLQTGTNMWHDVADGSSAKATYAYVKGGVQNLTGTSSRIFFIGGYRATTITPNAKAVIRLLDFGTDKVTTIMGGSADGVSAQTLTPGSVQGLTLSANCITASGCMIYYDRDTDYLYFSEDSKIRFIENVSTPANQRLRDLVTVTGSINSFIFTPSKDQVFYIKGGYLYCHNLTATSTWCNDSLLGPSTGLSSIGTVANQMTWLNDRSLLISTNGGEIYQYNLPAP